MTGTGTRLVGVFPSLECTGGLEASAGEAWRAIVEANGSDRSQGLFYRTGDSKAKMMFLAAVARRKADAIVVWHLHLLKLLPVLAGRRARIALFLHGVEAWRRVDPFTHVLLRKVTLFLSNSDFTWSRFVACNTAFEGAPHVTVHLGGGEPANMIPPPSPVPSVLMIGRLAAGEDYKGHRQMLAAWPLVLKRNPEARLSIVGDGTLRPTLEALAHEHGISRSVTFHGWVSEQDKARLIAESRCLAMPSRGEGFGLVYAEAMRLGRPCLVSNEDAGREVVNPPEAGLSVDPRDSAAVADAVCRLLDDEHGWHTWSHRARVRYEERFTGAHFRHRLTAALFDA
jgi:phosphatidylinositol alpha-1,6-mannosyltransferase